MSKNTLLSELINYVSANSSGNVTIAAPVSGYALNVSGTGKFTNSLELEGSGYVYTSLYDGGSTTTLASFYNYFTMTNQYSGKPTTDFLAYDYLNQELSLGTNGTTKLTIKSSGNVGIGTTAPSFKLQVEGDTYGTTGFFVRNTANTFLGSLNNTSGMIVNGTTYNTTIVSGGNYTMTLTTAGNVLIGTTTDSGYKLDVNGTGRFVSSSSFQGTFSGWSTAGANSASGAISLGSTAAYRGVISYAADGLTTLSFDNSYDNAGAIMQFRMRTSGTPITALSIAGTGAATFSSSVTAGTYLATSSGNELRLYNSVNNANFQLFNSSGTGASSLQFYDTAAASYRMTITSAGNVGIGTTSPSYGLDIQGSSAASAYLNITKTGYASAFMQPYNDGVYMGSFNSYPVYMRTNNSTVMTLTTSGNVGIGTTSPGKLLSVGSTSGSGTGTSPASMEAIQLGSQFGTGTIGTNFKHILFKADGLSDSYRYGFGVSEYLFEVMAGTGGSIAFFTNGGSERMRITSGGQVLIGQTVATGSSNGVYIRPGIESGFIVTNDIALQLSRLGSTGNIQSFYSGTSMVGSVSVGSSSTSFNTTSDYRLKEDLQPVEGLEIVDKINVYNYKWKSSDERMDGVLAHELAEVLPYAVIGEKDAKKMQGVDYSKIVPVMVQAIKELKAELDILKNN